MTLYDYILHRLRKRAAVTPLRHDPTGAHDVRLLSSLYGPERPERRELHRQSSAGIHYVAVESPRRIAFHAALVEHVREHEARYSAPGMGWMLVDRAVPVPNVGALCAARSRAHVPGGQTAATRMREDAASLCRAAVEEAEACVAAAGRARTSKTQASCAEHARVALEAARLVAVEFDLGADVVVPAYSVLAPHLWDIVAPAYAAEDRLRDGAEPIPDEDADALGTLI